MPARRESPRRTPAATGAERVSIGIELQERLAAQHITVPIIFITGHGDVHMAVRAIQSGAFDFIEKPFNDQDLLDRIQKAIVFDAEQRVKETQREHLRAVFASLTPREHEVLELVVEGMSNKGIAKSLGLSAKTIDFKTLFNVTCGTGVGASLDGGTDGSTDSGSKDAGPG
jgi:FixJ family two-component response regulator